jgi:hypothetical protein
LTRVQRAGAFIGERVFVCLWRLRLHMARERQRKLDGVESDCRGNLAVSNELFQFPQRQRRQFVDAPIAPLADDGADAWVAAKARAGNARVGIAYDTRSFGGAKPERQAEREPRL